MGSGDGGAIGRGASVDANGVSHKLEAAHACCGVLVETSPELLRDPGRRPNRSRAAQGCFLPHPDCARRRAAASAWRSSCCSARSHGSSNRGKVVVSL